jgi:hypothetical protein
MSSPTKRASVDRGIGTEALRWEATVNLLNQKTTQSETQPRKDPRLAQEDDGNNQRYGSEIQTSLTLLNLLLNSTSFDLRESPS